MMIPSTPAESVESIVEDLKLLRQILEANPGIDPDRDQHLAHVEHSIGDFDGAKFTDETFEFPKPTVDFSGADEDLRFLDALIRSGRTKRTTVSLNRIEALDHLSNSLISIEMIEALISFSGLL
jgi:hypothetical protein